MKNRILPGLLVLLSLAACRQSPSPAPAPSQAPAPTRHPLDPLAADEIRVAIEIARGDARLAGAAFPSINVLIPPKADVLAWRPGQSLPRQSRVEAMTAATTYELVVDVGSHRLVSMTERAGAEPAVMLSEIQAVQAVVENPEFKAALQKRGLTDFTKVFCAPFAAGYYGNPAREGNRLVKIGCFDTRRSTTNVFAWPVEGLYALMDLRKRVVLSVTDSGIVPIAEGDYNYTEAAAGTLRDPRKPTVLQQPGGPNFSIDGHQGDVGPVAFSRTHRSARRHGDFTGGLEGRPDVTPGAV